jgi:hypothetical protein
VLIRRTVVSLLAGFGRVSGTTQANLLSIEKEGVIYRLAVGARGGLDTVWNARRNTGAKGGAE